MRLAEASSVMSILALRPIGVKLSTLSTQVLLTPACCKGTAPLVPVIGRQASVSELHRMGMRQFQPRPWRDENSSFVFSLYFRRSIAALQFCFQSFVSFFPAHLFNLRCLFIASCVLFSSFRLSCTRPYSLNSAIRKYRLNQLTQRYDNTHSIDVSLPGSTGPA